MELVDAAIKRKQSFKRVGIRLEELEADEHAAQRLISAFEDQECPAWLTAFLLGCIGHDSGYCTVKQILTTYDALSSQSYAGVAMAKIRGLEAYDDLRDVLFGDYTKRVYRAASYGLVRTSAPQLFGDLLAAYDRGHLLRSHVSFQIAQCEPPDEWLLTLLHSENLNHRKMVCSVIESMLQQQHLASPGEPVEHAVRNLLQDETLAMMPRRRKVLDDWVSGGV